MLELQHISWTAPGGSQVLRDVSVKIPEGKLTVITGPNGGGKTTLAKIIAGLETPDSGRILLDGKDITDLDVTQRAKEGVSFAFQQPVRFKGFTVRRLLELAAGAESAHGEAVRVCSAGWACAAGSILTGRWTPPCPAARSSGSRSPPCWPGTPSCPLFDEPEAGIDLWSFTNLIDVFQSLQEASFMGLCIIISHQERILEIADEIVVIAGGTLKEHGSRGGGSAPVDRGIAAIARHV